MVECEWISNKPIKHIVTVLIDTWWNVNDKVYTIYNADGVGFNRYMVECEFLADSWTVLDIIRFNRYMVECESERIDLWHAPTRKVLIDTWWNVNAEELEEKVGADAF